MKFGMVPEFVLLLVGLVDISVVLGKFRAMKDSRAFIPLGGTGAVEDEYRFEGGMIPRS